MAQTNSNLLRVIPSYRSRTAAQLNLLTADEVINEIEHYDITYEREPEVSLIRDNLHGMSFFRRFWHLCTVPPRFSMTESWSLTMMRDGEVTIVIPRLFVTDFASIPGLFWNIPGMSPLGPLKYGALLHDFAYQYGFLLRLTKSGLPFQIFEKMPRDFYDRLLATITAKLTGAVTTSMLSYDGLKLGGWHAWNKYRTEGPSAFNTNSLQLAGRTKNGFRF